MHDYKTTSLAIKQSFEKAQNILIISHQKPDGDTLGANFALHSFLKNLNKNVTSFCIDPMADLFKFLPGSESLKTDHLVFSKKYDLVIMVDSASLSYAGVDKLMTSLTGYTMINIDHHASNPLYADLNLVITSASSCTEVIYRLFKDWKIKISPEIATCLACGMITDTSGFVNPATNYQVLQAASDLIKNGANLSQISQITLGTKNVNNLKLWGRALDRLKNVDKYGLVYTFVTQQDFVECQADDSAAEGLSNFLHVLQGAKIILVLKEAPNNLIKGSLRTTSDNIDLAKLAGYLGGGGHKKAAGFVLQGRLSYDNNKLRII